MCRTGRRSCASCRSAILSVISYTRAARNNGLNRPFTYRKNCFTRLARQSRPGHYPGSQLCSLDERSSSAMCGIVGLFLKNPALQPELGTHLETMLIGMSERGPDSAGIAVYHSPWRRAAASSPCSTPTNYHWRKLAGDLGKALNVKTEVDQKGNHALLIAKARRTRSSLAARQPSRRPHHGLWPADGGLQGHGPAGRRSRRATASQRWQARMPSAIPAWRPKAR